jgi:DNA-binding NarL/FixJ family response regulator
VDATASARTIRVFLLDDHDAFLRGISAIIGAQADLEVVGDAHTAQEALAALSNCHPDIAVLDIRLDGPDVHEERRSGIDVCRDIQATHPEAACLMLTAFADDRALVETSLAGAAAFVLKQINGANLLDSIRRVSDGLSPERCPRTWWPDWWCHLPNESLDGHRYQGHRQWLAPDRLGRHDHRRRPCHRRSDPRDSVA